MADINRLLKTIKEYNKKYTITEDSSEADKLIAKIQEKKYSEEDYFETEKAVSDFMRSDASEEDKQKVRGHTESLYMMISEIRDYGLKI